MTTNQFKKKHNLKNLPELRYSTIKKYAYLGYFKYQGKIYVHNGYGPPGYIDLLPFYGKLPKDIKLCN